MTHTIPCRVPIVAIVHSCVYYMLSIIMCIVVHIKLEVHSFSTSGKGLKSYLKKGGQEPPDLEI